MKEKEKTIQGKDKNKKNNNNQENKYHVWYINKTKSNENGWNKKNIQKRTQNKERSIKRKKILNEFFSPLFLSK